VRRFIQQWTVTDLQDGGFDPNENRLIYYRYESLNYLFAKEILNHLTVPICVNVSNVFVS